MDSLDDLKLGCIIPEEIGPAIQFDAIVPAQLFSTQATKEVSRSEDTPNDPLLFPKAVDNLAPFGSWNMLGNNRYGDCVPVTWANMRRLVTSKLSGRELYPTMDQVIQLYKIGNPELTPDMGMEISKVLKYLVDKGGPDGVKAVAYAQIDFKNHNHIRAALAIFGCLWLGINVDLQNKQEFDYKQPWKIPSIDQSLGGHSVLVGGYSADSDLKIVTWGKPAQLSKEFVQKRAYEAWVVIWPEYFGTRRFMKTVSLNRLQNEFKLLKGTELSVPAMKLNPILVTTAVQPVGDWLEVLKLEPTYESSDQIYNSPPTLSRTPIKKALVTKGKLTVDNDDVYLIKTEETKSIYVEVYRLLGPGYFDLDSETPITTAFRRTLSTKGIFTIDNGDLYFITYPDPVTQVIEIHYASNQQGYQAVEVYKTKFKIPSITDRMTISGGDLFLISRSSSSGFVELYCSKGNANYAEPSLYPYVTGFSLESVSDTLFVGLNGDLYEIKHAGTDSGKVQVNIASGRSNYGVIQNHTTSIDTDEHLQSTQRPPVFQRSWIF